MRLVFAFGLGCTTTVSTELALSSPSSQVTKSTPPCFHAAELRITGTVFASHASAVAVEQSCPSWHISGVIQTNRGTVPFISAAKCVKGTTLGGHLPP